MIRSCGLKFKLLIENFRREASSLKLRSLCGLINWRYFTILETVGWFINLVKLSFCAFYVLVSLFCLTYEMTESEWARSISCALLLNFIRKGYEVVTYYVWHA